MPRHPFIVLEGLSGVGKTALAKSLARELGGVYYHTPPDPFARTRRAVDETCGPQARYWFYLAGVTHASEEIRDLSTRVPVVCDRYLATTHCWHSLVAAAVLETYEPLRLLEPTVAALVTCDDGERKRRLSKRGRTPNDLEESKGGREDDLLAAYRRWRMQEIDNTHSVDRAVGELLALVEESTIDVRRLRLSERSRAPASMSSRNT